MDQRVARGLVNSANRPAPPAPEHSNSLRGLVPRPVEQHHEAAAKSAADLNQGERMKLAKEGKALPDGSFPIRSAEDLHKAMVRAHQASDEGAAKSHIRKRAKELGVSLPKGY